MEKINYTHSQKFVNDLSDFLSQKISENGKHRTEIEISDYETFYTIKGHTQNAKIYKACHDQRTIAANQAAVRSSDEIISNLKLNDVGAINRYSPATVYQRGITPFIYPSTHNESLFQVHKFDAVQTFLPAYASWVPAMHNNSRVTQMIESDFKLFYSSISSKYLNSTKTGFNSCFKKYLLGYKINFINK